MLAKREERRPSLLEVAHAGHHVDDRLGREAGNGCRADMMNPAFQPWSEHALEQRLFSLEATRPSGVVGSDGDQLVRHAGSLDG